MVNFISLSMLLKQQNHISTEFITQFKKKFSRHQERDNKVSRDFQPIVYFSSNNFCLISCFAVSRHVEININRDQTTQKTTFNILS